MILGIDISTSITGFAIVAEGEIVFYDSVDLRKYKNLFEKTERIKEALFNIFDNYQFCREDDHWMEIDQDNENKIKQAGIKVPRGQKAKQVVLQYLLDNEPAFKIEYTKHGNPKPESYDRADAIIVAKAGWAIEQSSSEEDTE